MSRELRQSTAQTELIGPFLDVGDGFTEETGLTPPTEIAKDGAAYAAGPTGGTHDSDGWYPVAFTTTHTNTLGSLMLKSHDNTTHLPVWHEFEVITANEYDSKYGTDIKQADVTQWLGTAVPAPGTAGVPSVDITHVDGVAGGGDEIADKVWDEVLTGATHNVVNSSGRRLRTLQDFGLYEGGAVWIDTVNGTAGTVDFENGTVNNPVNSIADALTIAGSVGLVIFHVLPGSSFTLAASVAGFEFVGFSYTVTLNGQSISGTLFNGATITGNDSGANAVRAHFINCTMGSNTLGEHSLSACALSGDVVLAEAADYFWDQCYSAMAGGGTPSVDYESAAETKTMSLRHYSGGMEIKNHGAGGGTHTTSLEGHGQLVINASCAGGSVNVRGHFKITETGTVTLTDRVNFESILDDGTTVYDRTTDSLQEIRDRGDAAWITATSVAVSAGGITTGSFAAGAIDAAAIATDAVDADALATDAVNEIAAAIGPQQNQAFSDLTFLMVDETDGKTPETGLSPTGERSINGAAFVAVSGTIAEVSDGIYQFDALAADMNGAMVIFRFSATGALDTFVTIKTTP